MISFKEFLSEAPQWAKVNRVRRDASGKIVIQRRKKISMRPGYRMQNGKLVRMTSMEKRRRHLAQIKGARKRKPMISRILRKRKLSNLRRRSAGIK